MAAIGFELLADDAIGGDRIIAALVRRVGIP